MGESTDVVDPIRTNTDNVDQISNFPPFIIHQIMSHLSRKEVVQTSVLSKRWNYLQASFPIFNFDESDLFQTDLEMRLASDEIFRERIENFIKCIDVSLLRFCELKFSMQTFRLFMSHVDVKGLPSFIEKWIGLAVENEVKELDVTINTKENKLYILPRTIFSAKSLITLKLNGFKLDQPSNAMRFCFLKKLKLFRVHISEPMVQKLTSECPVLEELSFLYCWGLKCVCICKPHKLKIMKINAAPNEVESVKIDIPCLQQFDLMLYQRPCVIDLSGCLQLKDLHLACCVFEDEEFHYLISKFPLLENLSMGSCHFLERIKVSSNQLKNLSIGNCGHLEAIDVDTPNLLSFTYQNNIVPISSINAPCSWIVSFVIEGDLDADWYLSLKKFLVASSQIKELTLYVTSNKVSFDLEEFQKDSPSPPCEVGYVSLFPEILPSDYGALLDGLLWVCYPKCLSIEAWEKDHSKLIESLYEKLTNRDVSCCHSYHVKCWRHYLKDIRIESFTPLVDQKPIVIDNLMDVLPNLPRGSLRLHLDWCFPVLAEMLNVETPSVLSHCTTVFESNF